MGARALGLIVYGTSSTIEVCGRATGGLSDGAPDYVLTGGVSIRF